MSFNITKSIANKFIEEHNCTIENGMSDNRENFEFMDKGSWVGSPKEHFKTFGFYCPITIYEHSNKNYIKKIFQEGLSEIRILPACLCYSNPKYNQYFGWEWWEVYHWQIECDYFNKMYNYLHNKKEVKE